METGFVEGGTGRRLFLGWLPPRPKRAALRASQGEAEATPKTENNGLREGIESRSTKITQ